MMWEMIIMSAVLIISVIVHIVLWRDSTKQHEEIMNEFQALSERMKQLEANYDEMDGVLDAADEDMERIGREIDTLRSAWFVKGKNNPLAN